MYTIMIWDRKRTLICKFESEYLDEALDIGYRWEMNGFDVVIYYPDRTPVYTTSRDALGIL